MSYQQSCYDKLYGYFTLQQTQLSQLCNKLLNQQQALACNKPFHARSCCRPLWLYLSRCHPAGSRVKLSTAANIFCKYARPQKVVALTCRRLRYRLIESRMSDHCGIWMPTTGCVSVTAQDTSATRLHVTYIGSMLSSCSNENYNINSQTEPDELQIWVQEYF